MKKSSTWNLTLLSNVKFQLEDFFQILWPFQNIRTLHCANVCSCAVSCQFDFAKFWTARKLAVWVFLSEWAAIFETLQLNRKWFMIAKCICFKEDTHEWMEPTKGQLISKANFEVFIWTRIFLYFCPSL